MKWLDELFKFLASLKLAVIVILGIGIISAVGTIYEARYDATYAQKVVYHSVYMWVILGLLVVNLVAVMVDRWPWKRHHIGFVMAHIGIIIMLLGSVMTSFYGVDGSMAFDVGGSNRLVTLPQHQFSIYSSFPDSGIAELMREEVDFFMNPISEDQPVVYGFGSKKAKIKKYYHYGVRSSSIEKSKADTDGPGIRFQLQNANINMSEWILKPKSRSYQVAELGPARVVLSDGSYQYVSGNEIILHVDEGSSKIRYSIHTASQGGQGTTGTIEAGQSLETGWMGLTLRVLRFLPKAREEISYSQRQYPNKITHPAILLDIDGVDYWMALNSQLKIFDTDKVFTLVYGNKLHPVLPRGEKLKLLEFRMDKYQGTNRAATYESDVFVPGIGRTTISMNEPLKHNGYTFYQASFEQDETGQPTTSILSVNFDPGRGLKYFGCLLLVLGSLVLFYFKKTFLKKKVSSAP